MRKLPTHRLPSFQTAPPSRAATAGQQGSDTAVEGQRVLVDLQDFTARFQRVSSLGATTKWGGRTSGCHLVDFTRTFPLAFEQGVVHWTTEGGPLARCRSRQPRQASAAVANRGATTVRVPGPPEAKAMSPATRFRQKKSLSGEKRMRQGEFENEKGRRREDGSREQWRRGE